MVNILSFRGTSHIKWNELDQLRGNPLVVLWDWKKQEFKLTVRIASQSQFSYYTVDNPLGGDELFQLNDKPCLDFLSPILHMERKNVVVMRPTFTFMKTTGLNKQYHFF